jgi:hypothetical protein
MTNRYRLEMIDTYKKLCYDGHFDIAFSIMDRYTLDMSAFHSNCIVNHINGQTHYEYCRQHNIMIDYNNAKPYVSFFSRITPFFSRITPHPEMNTLYLDIVLKLHIMFPKYKTGYNYTPPSKNTIKELQTILKDKLTFTAKEIFDNKTQINEYTNIHYVFDYNKFLIFIIKNFNPDVAYSIVRALNCGELSIDYKPLISSIVIHNNKQHMKSLNYILEASTYGDVKYCLNLGMNSGIGLIYPRMKRTIII